MDGPASREPSVKDVAAVAGVSLGTVSNVLNRPERVRPGTRERVERAMAELGFVRNELARQLRAGTGRTIGYVMLDATNPFFTDVALGIELAAEAADLSLFLCNSNNRESREDAYVARLLQQRVQGILITPVNPQSLVLTAAAQQHLPVVLVDRRRSDDAFCSVSVDDVLGGWLAVMHLVAQGHRRIAVIGGAKNIGQVRERVEGARKAWHDSGLPPEDLVMLETKNLSIREGLGAGERLAGIARRPTAAFCANDMLALGLLQRTIGLGMKVPDDLAIIGFDDIDFAGAAAVPLSSVRQPRTDLGKTAAQLLIEEMVDRQHDHRRVVFTPEVVARASTA
jgi:LacI family transcriptional regulator